MPAQSGIHNLGVKVFDVLGQLLISCPDNRIDVSHLPEGMYIISIMTGTSIKTEKFIIER